MPRAGVPARSATQRAKIHKVAAHLLEGESEREEALRRIARQISRQTFLPDCRNGGRISVENFIQCSITHRMVTPGLFATLGIPLLRGRDFTSQDSALSERVVVVNEVLPKLKHLDAGLDKAA